MSAVANYDKSLLVLGSALIAAAWLGMKYGVPRSDVLKHFKDPKQLPKAFGWLGGELKTKEAVLDDLVALEEKKKEAEASVQEIAHVRKEVRDAVLPPRRVRRRRPVAQFVKSVMRLYFYYPLLIGTALGVPLTVLIIAYEREMARRTAAASHSPDFLSLMSVPLTVLGAGRQTRMLISPSTRAQR